MANIRVSLKSNGITGTLTGMLEIGLALVFWDGYNEGDAVPISELDGVAEVETVEIVPDNRTYEFGIGSINDDPYYSEALTRPTGKTKLIAVGKCDGCGGTFPRAHLMSASLGTACPDCYDRMSE